ncbi:MAG: class I SAM-dependent methyltransferase [Candidatus Thorarchaeota archaeon]
MTEPVDIEIKWRYDLIPDKLLEGEILEIGAGYPERPLASRHRERFLKANEEERYLGIDLIEPENPSLNILKMDIFELDVRKKFDTIIALEVIEHIDLRLWPELFEIMRELLKTGGYLFISTPYREPSWRFGVMMEKYGKDQPWNVHVVYDICPELLGYFLPEAKFSYTYKKRPFFERGDAKIRAFVRWFKRVLTLHKFAWQWLPYKAIIAALWQKKEELI